MTCPTCLFSAGCTCKLPNILDAAIHRPPRINRPKATSEKERVARILEHQRAYTRKNRDAINARSRESARRRDQDKKHSINERKRAWRAANKDKAVAERARRKEKHGEKDRLSAIERRARDPERARARYRLWVERNRLRLREYSNNWKARNKEKASAVYRQWRIKNPSATAELKAKRRAAQLQRTPKWLTAEEKKQIKEIYRVSGGMTKTTGIPHCVDHICPLQGVTVSGLHVPWNLQILTRAQNAKKHNKHIDE